jgi:hypothetical protein
MNIISSKNLRRALAICSVTQQIVRAASRVTNPNIEDPGGIGGSKSLTPQRAKLAQTTDYSLWTPQSSITSEL